MRSAALAALLALALVSPALCAPTLDELRQDSAKKKELDRGSKILDKYFKAESELAKGGRRAAANAADQAEAQTEFLAWLAATGDSPIGLDLRGQPDVVVDMLDEARVKYLQSRYRKGSIDYVSVEGARGMKRHEYAILVPKSYDPKSSRIPVVITLHGRVINPRHPAFRGADFGERSRQTVWNNWYKTPAADEVLVLAPTTSPDGFRFADNHFEELQIAYRTLGEALTNYRGDWERCFIEVHGEALRVACEQAFMFAGVLFRDRIDDRRAPAIPPEQFFLLENLNGIPLVYIADQANWDQVGKPMSEALTAAYAAAGKPENLVVIQAQRDVDGALRGGEEKIAEFLKTQKRPKVRETFRWRFFEPMQGAPFPVEFTLMNFNYDVSDEAKKKPLAEKAGRLVFDAHRETVKDAEGNDVQINVIDLKVTEAEGLKIRLFEPLVNFDLPLTVRVNGQVIEGFDRRKISRDWTLFFDNVLPLRFFMAPILNSVELTFPHQPEFAPPAPEEPAVGQEKPAEGGEEKKPAEEDPKEGESATGSGAVAGGEDGGKR